MDLYTMNMQRGTIMVSRSFDIWSMAVTTKRKEGRKENEEEDF